jgi:hypothetical protein
MIKPSRNQLQSMLEFAEQFEGPVTAEFVRNTLAEVPRIRSRLARYMEGDPSAYHEAIYHAVNDCPASLTRDVLFLASTMLAMSDRIVVNAPKESP